MKKRTKVAGLLVGYAAATFTGAKAYEAYEGSSQREPVADAVDAQNAADNARNAYHALIPEGSCTRTVVLTMGAVAANPTHEVVSLFALSASEFAEPLAASCPEINAEATAEGLVAALDKVSSTQSESDAAYDETQYDDTEIWAARVTGGLIGATAVAIPSVIIFIRNMPPYVEPETAIPVAAGAP